MADTNELAAKLRTDGTSLIDMPFADKVNVTHDPPKDTDGPMDGDRLRAVLRAEVEAMARAFAEPPERELLGTTVDGAFVTTRSAVRGVLVNGTTVDYQTEVVIEIRDGKIVGLHARLDDENARQHRAALTAGAFERPSEGAST